MAVSKRLRFEILRRDNHACRYCGRSAPEVKLTIDHVVPETLGGSDDPDNLVAACSDCNGGKSSASPDATMVADVASDAVRWSAAIKQAADEMALHDNTAVYEAVVNAWTSFRRNQIPGDYRETIDQFLNAGLPPDDIVQMVHVADAKPSIYNRWSYFCGCCWTRVRQLHERAGEILSEPGTTSEIPQNSLVTRWTLEEIDQLVAQARCVYEHWVPDGPDACCRHLADGHCGDPICKVEYIGLLMEEVDKVIDARQREREIQEAL